MRYNREQKRDLSALNHIKYDSSNRPNKKTLKQIKKYASQINWHLFVLDLRDCPIEKNCIEKNCFEVFKLKGNPKKTVQIQITKKISPLQKLFHKFLCVKYQLILLGAYLVMDFAIIQTLFAISHSHLVVLIFLIISIQHFVKLSYTVYCNAHYYNELYFCNNGVVIN